MSIEKPKTGLEKDPQIEKSWGIYKERFEKVKDVKKIAELVGNLHLHSDEAGSELINASLEIKEPLKKMLEAADEWEKEMRTAVEKMLANKYGSGKIGYRINPDGSLELSDGSIYGQENA